MPEEVRQELTPFYLNRSAIANKETDCEKIDKLTDEDSERIQPGLAVSLIPNLQFDLTIPLL